MQRVTIESFMEHRQITIVLISLKGNWNLPQKNNLANVATQRYSDMLHLCRSNLRKMFRKSDSKMGQIWQ